jgi:mRNA interferase MazF
MTSPVEAPLVRIMVGPMLRRESTSKSRIMDDKVTTMPRSNVRERLVRLDDEDLARLDGALIVSLGLAD